MLTLFSLKFTSIEETPKNKRSEINSDNSTSGIFIPYRSLSTVINMGQPSPKIKTNTKLNDIELDIASKQTEEEKVKVLLKKNDSFLNLPFYFEVENYVPNYSSDDEEEKAYSSNSPTMR